MFERNFHRASFFLESAIGVRAIILFQRAFSLVRPVPLVWDRNPLLFESRQTRNSNDRCLERSMNRRVSEFVFFDRSNIQQDPFTQRISHKGPNNIMTYNTTMPNQRTSLRYTKRQWATSKATNCSSILPRPDMIKRSTSLPTKLEKAPPTKKLFWFRPVCFLQEKENRLESSLIVQSFPRVESRHIPHLPTLYDDESATRHHIAEESEDLVGLGFLD